MILNKCVTQVCVILITNNDIQELSDVEPALREAEEAVGGIDAKSLNEMKNLAKPPDGIRLALSAVCTLLEGKKVDKWDDIRKNLRDSGFITRVANFDSDGLPQNVQDLVGKIMKDKVVLVFIKKMTQKYDEIIYISSMYNAYIYISII